MPCLGCGTRQRPRGGFCEQCGAPEGVLSTPRRLDQGGERRLCLYQPPPALPGAHAALLGVPCAVLGALPFLPALVFCALALGLGCHGARHAVGPWRWLARLVLLLSGVGLGCK